jgi:hypothetical protein
MSLAEGESIVTLIIVKSVLTILALLGAFFTFRRWLKRKRIWYIISAAAAVLAALSVWLSWTEGIFLLVCALLLFALAEFYKKK